MKNSTGIIGAMNTEISPLKHAMTETKVTTISGMDFVEGKLDGKDVVVVKCGAGKVNAGICTELLIYVFGVKSVINTGIAGSLNDEINIGDIVVSTDVVQHDFDGTLFEYQPGEIPGMGIVAFLADDEMRIKAVKAARVLSAQVFEGRVCSGDRFIAYKEQREHISSTFGGLCCEMEGGAIGQVCYLNKIPFVIIRAISDMADGSKNGLSSELSKKAAKRCAVITRYMVAH